jgi:hypothetical protein
MLEQMAIALVGGEAVWAGMSLEMQQLWLERARRGLKVAEESSRNLRFNLEWLLSVLQQIAYPSRGDREITVQRLTAIAQAVLLEFGCQ